MAQVRFDHAAHTYRGAERPAVDDLELDIHDGELMVLVGPSGCGKSTSLRMLAGLEEISSGSIRIGGQDVTDVAPKDRDIAMVFQTYALYPQLTVGENMAFALKVARVPRSERSRRVREAAELLDLTAVLDHKPRVLSGGQRQRVAMGRAIVRQPQVFCMDEPLSNLDAKLRVSTRTQIAALQRRLEVTTVYVTHDQVEAMTMGDRVAVLKDGVLQQVDTPLALYERPTNLFVAGFIGSPAMNLLPAATRGDGSAVLHGHQVAVPRSVTGAASSGALMLGIRPEDWRIATSDESGLVVTVDVVEELGSDAFVYGRPAGTPAPDQTADPGPSVVVRLDGRRRLQPGQQLELTVDPEALHVFDSGTGDRLTA
ncbi:ABC transporter ATP-binding protein [Aeromicrobium sp. CF4.19]|uniref:ABC transporter ATP-binding protein n=1 Tax=Aeromicrobium sp. CF4.19 TaxID=3373082 RepID=UPI003EE4B893